MEAPSLPPFTSVRRANRRERLYMRRMEPAKRQKRNIRLPRQEDWHFMLCFGPLTLGDPTGYDPENVAHTTKFVAGRGLTGN